jgi:hypothetical protein
LRRAGWLESRRTLHGFHHRPCTPREDAGGACARDAIGATARDTVGANDAPYLFNEPDVYLNQNGEPPADAVNCGCSGDPPKPPAAAAASASRGENSLKPNAPAATSVEAATTLVEELVPQHPEPGNPGKAIDEIAKVLDASQDLEQTARTIRERHAAWREHWATLPRDRFIPQLWRWLRDGEWNYQPADRKCVKRESFDERRRRELRECDERHWMMLAKNGWWEDLAAEGQDPEVWRAKVEVA